jgi:hypothetical protein
MRHPILRARIHRSQRFFAGKNRTLFKTVDVLSGNRGKGFSEIEGKVARVATSERGTRSEFQTAAPYRATRPGRDGQEGIAFECGPDD